MSETTDREARLPKWARDELASLRRRVDEVEQRLAAVEMEPSTLVVTDPYDVHPRPVAKAGEDVRFYLDRVDGYRWLDVRVQHDRTVRVMASTGLRITPQVTNVLTLDLTR